MVIDWKEAAREVAKELPKGRINERVLQFLKENTGKVWSLGCSGGVDSLAMVLWIVGMFGSEGKVILHYNHKMRPEADAEDAFVKKVARELGVGCICEERTEALEKSNEEALRNLRMEFFKRAMEQARSIILVTGHHLNDVAETVFMRLTRGSGTQGLAAPRPLQRRGKTTMVVRPFLDLRKEEVDGVMRGLKLQWCEDASNAMDIYFRNRMRMEIIPLLEKIAPTDFWKSIQRSRELLEEDDNALESWLGSLVGYEKFEEVLNMEKVLDKPVALQRRLLQKWMHHMQKNLSAQGMDLFLEMINWRKPNKISCEDGWLVFDKKCVRFEVAREEDKNWGINRLVIGSEVYLPSGGVLQAQWVDLDDDLRGKILSGDCDKGQEAYISMEGKREVLCIRQWVCGDYYKPLGLGGRTKKLQDMFVDCKIGVSRRHQLPIILNEGEIVWCPGLVISDKYRINEDTQLALRLTFLGNTGRNKVKVNSVINE